MLAFVYRLAEIDSAAQFLFENYKDKAIWLFDGQMGAGKTTLISAICREIGIRDDVQSPTFSIVNEYITTDGDTVYHFDCYRLKSEIEAFDIGIEEYLYSGSRCLIEWPDKITNLLPNTAITVKIDIISDSERRIFVSDV